VWGGHRVGGAEWVINFIFSLAAPSFILGLGEGDRNGEREGQRGTWSGSGALTHSKAPERVGVDGSLHCVKLEGGGEWGSPGANQEVGGRIR